MDTHKLTELELDALCEVGGICAAHAATTLSELVDQAIMLSVPRVEVIGFPQIAELFETPETLVLGAYARISGDVTGGVLLMADADAALEIVLLSRGAGDDIRPASVSPDSEARFRHLSTMLISSFTGALSRLTGLGLLPAGQAFGFDMAGALLEVVAVDFDQSASEVVVVHVPFVREGAKPGVAMFFVPDPDTLPVLFTRLGLT